MTTAAPISSLRKRRLRKFKAQNGRCWWCGNRMELEPFRCTPFGNLKHNPAYATFEHLRRKRDGGRGMPNNVVLAHAACNRNRETRDVTSVLAAEVTA